MVELRVDIAASSHDTAGLPTEPVTLKVRGTAVHRSETRFMYIFPGHFSETTTVAQLISRNGQSVEGPARDARMYSPPKDAVGEVLGAGAERKGALASDIVESNGVKEWRYPYDLFRVQARKGEPVHIDVTSHSAAQLGIQLLPPKEFNPLVLASRLIAPQQRGMLDYLCPAEGELRLMVFSKERNGDYSVARR